MPESAAPAALPAFFSRYTALACWANVCRTYSASGMARRKGSRKQESGNSKLETRNWKDWAVEKKKYRCPTQQIADGPPKNWGAEGRLFREPGLTLLDCSAYSPCRAPTPLCCEGPPFFVEDRFRFMARGNFGERLKRERELREVSMDELTKATRISTRFVEALENEDWEKLPGGVFGHGFVRTIARYLGLNEEALLGEYDMARAEHSPTPPRLEERIPTPPKWLPVSAALVLLLLS